jgi:hypothetical protein
MAVLVGVQKLFNVFNNKTREMVRIIRKGMGSFWKCFGTS